MTTNVFLLYEIAKDRQRGDVAVTNDAQPGRRARQRRRQQQEQRRALPRRDGC